MFICVFYCIFWDNKPVLNHTAKRFKINMISAITNTGKSMFALYDENMNVDRFINFLEKVINSNKNKNKIFMIVDNLKVHHARVIASLKLKICRD